MDPSFTTTTAAPTPAPTPSACGSPQWFGDNYCDDDNNNESCGWDGGKAKPKNHPIITQSSLNCNSKSLFTFSGDCCGDDVNTTFCSECACLDPNGPAGVCEDIWSEAKCIKRKNKGKCNKKKVKKNCQKTCEYCS